MKRTKLITLTILTATLGILLVLSSFLPLLIQRPPIYETSDEYIPYQQESAPPQLNLAPIQNFTFEGEADMTTFIVGSDGSMTSTIIAAGDIGDIDPTQSHYAECALALSLFRWGDYLDVFTSLMAFLTNDSGGGGGSELDMLFGLLDLLPPNALFMIFIGGSQAEIQGWGYQISQDFTSTIGISFTRIFGMVVPLSPTETFGIEAYGYYGESSPDPVDIQGRDAFQNYMEYLGSSRNGGSELVTPTLADDSVGGVGLAGFINFAALGGMGSPAPLPIKAPMQTNESITIAAWASRHEDKFFGRTEQTFDVNDFTGRSENITIGSLDIFEFMMMFPSDVNITSYVPTDMVNSTTPEFVMVLRSTTHWINNASSVENIIVNFEGDFPPGLTIQKTLTSSRIPVGGTTTVTITLTNIDPTITVTNVQVDDTHSWDAYLALTSSHVIFTGSMSANWASIAPGQSVSLTYQITITGEGGYVSQRTNVTYEDDLARTWEKSSNQVYLTVAYASIFDFLLTILRDIPWSIPVLIVVALMVLYVIIWLIQTILGIFRGSKTATSKPPPPPTTPTAPTPKPPPPPEFESLDKEYGEAVCSYCGGLIPPGVSFCPACGSKVSEI
ncbi:MAG: zinc ribbon domain-containing protein [Candidatus Hodarchaeota archaeon]